MEEQNSKYIVLKRGDAVVLYSYEEASQYMGVMKDQQPEAEFEILEVHPPRPRGLGRDPDLH